jgi:hydroxyethylthiazole kinase-like uncharacterized protein yjeF
VSTARRPDPTEASRALPCAVIRELDRRAIEEWGIPSFALMENAARACGDQALRMVGAGRVLVLAGPGNNGGDGLAIARTLANRGVRTQVRYLGADPTTLRLSADFRKNLDLWYALGGRCDAPVDPGAVDLVVDALFGNGLSRPLGEPWKSAIDALNAAHVPVLAVDVPSGLDADTGEVLGTAVRATETVTFIAPKLGFFRCAGPEHIGRLHVAEIGVPSPWIEAEIARARP